MNPLQDSGSYEGELWSLERLMRRGAITTEQRNRLEAILREEPGTRRFYLDYLESHFSNPAHASEGEQAADPDFWSLLEMQYDGRLTPEQQQRFDAIMHKDPSARKFFQAYTGKTTEPAVPAAEEVLSLAEAQIEEGLDEARSRRLEALLEADVGHRRLYLAYLDQHATLRWSFRGGENRKS